MNIKSLALVLGATVALVGGGMGAVACSSSSSGGSSSGSSSGGSGGSSGSSSGSTMDSGNEDTGTGDAGSGSSSGGSSSGGADCGAKIPSLHPNPAGDIYCGYAPGDSGATIDCVADSGMGFCCLGGSLGWKMYAPQICGASVQDCHNDGNPEAGTSGQGIPIQCNQISDCPGNGAPGATACCLQGATETSCSGGFTKAVSGNGIVCEGDGGTGPTTCQAGELQICSGPADCPTGTTCKAGKWKIYDIGFCQ